jgi:inosine-uridine nucleoside N-ribohydrolase
MSDARPAIVLDCDPGHDDAVAIVVAAHTTDLLGITTVAGNAPLERTTHNACVVRHLLGLDVEVHSGAQRPLVVEPADASFVHGASGLDGADLPTPARGPDGSDAVAFIIETCRAHEGTWIVGTGPLTNVALALRSAPDLSQRIAGISLMGGGTFGNRTSVAEFNIWADPEAAAAVFSCGAPIVMTGLDVTHRFIATGDRIERIRAIPGRLASILGDLFEFFSSTYRARHDDIDGAAVHDPLAVMVLTHPELFQRVTRHVDVETSGWLTRGMTVIDQRTLVERPEGNCDVVVDVDADGAWSVVTRAVEAFSR